jgi:hypothetical protein
MNILYSIFLFLNFAIHLVYSKSNLKKTTVITTSSNALKTSKSNNSTNSIFSKIGKNGEYQLTYYGLMLSGAVARSIAATAVQPLTLIKTMLQKRNGKMPEISWRVLTRGSGTQFIMSVPHGALNFAVTEVSRFL